MFAPSLCFSCSPSSLLIVADGDLGSLHARPVCFHRVVGLAHLEDNALPELRSEALVGLPVLDLRLGVVGEGLIVPIRHPETEAQGVAHVLHAEELAQGVLETTRCSPDNRRPNEAFRVIADNGIRAQSGLRVTGGGIKHWTQPVACVIDLDLVVLLLDVSWARVSDSSLSLMSSLA